MCILNIHFILVLVNNQHNKCRHLRYWLNNSLQKPNKIQFARISMYIFYRHFILPEVKNDLYFRWPSHYLICRVYFALFCSPHVILFPRINIYALIFEDANSVSIEVHVGSNTKKYEKDMHFYFDMAYSIWAYKIQIIIVPTWNMASAISYQGHLI